MPVSKIITIMKNNKLKLLALLSVLIISQLLASCMQFRTSTKKIYEGFSTTKNKLKIDTFDTLGYTIRYSEVVTNEALPTVIFIHGAPGSMSDLMRFMKDEKLASKANLVSVDRPGYGYSNFGKPLTSIDKQSEILGFLIRKYQNKQKIILVGHSYGGAIVARLAAEYPNEIKGLVLAAPVLDPKNEKIFWFTHLAHWGGIRWMLPTSLCVASFEKVTHASELELLMPYWRKITTPTTIIHGEADGLAPFINVEFCKKMVTNAPLETITKKDMGHLIPWKNPELIYNAIYKYLDEKNFNY